MNFWASAPPKEGRLSPGFPPSNLRTNAKVRLTIILFVLGILIYTITSSSGGISGISKRALNGGPKAQNVLSPEQTAGVVSTQKSKPIPVSEGHTSPATVGGRDHHLETALAKAISILPSEVAMRAFLSEMPGTGEEKVRELGLRARAFKTYFEAWEDVHLVHDGDQIHIRDDVIQYLRRTPEAAASLSSDFVQLVHDYEAYRTFIQKFSEMLFPWTSPYFADHMTLHTHFYNGGRGIVLSGGDEQAPFILTVIATFRELGCTLPVEVHYLGDEDLGEDWREKMEAMEGVVTRDIRAMVRDEGWQLKGWAGKPFTILLSSFREAMFVDADSLFFKDPETLFDDPQYQKTGALFFKDRLIMPESKKKWLQQILPAPISRNVKESRFWTGVSGHQQESGVVVVDKWKHFVSLLMVSRMNGPDRDGNSDQGIVGIYDMVYGDKETFWLGWELVGDRSYAFHNGLAGIMGKHWTPTEVHQLIVSESEHPEELPPPEDLAPANASDSETDPSSFTICAPQLLHLDYDDRPIWFNGWILDEKHGTYDHLSVDNFPMYILEPVDGRKPDPWQLHPNNKCCLTADKAYGFLPEEKQVLEMLVQQTLLYNT